MRGATGWCSITYVVGSGNELFVMAQNVATGTAPLLVGTAINQTTSTFSTASVKGTSVLWSDGTTNPSVSPIKDQVYISQLSLDGSGNWALTQDENAGGTVSGPAVYTGTYTVTSAGYLTIAESGGPTSISTRRTPASAWTARPPWIFTPW